MPVYGREVYALMQAVDALREDAIDMPVQQILTLLAVALEPGLTMATLGERVGMSQSSCSRNVMALSDWSRHRVPGLGLVEARDDPRERRRKIVNLTAKGEARIARAMQALLNLRG